MTLHKILGGKKIVVARYAQKWGELRGEGILFIDGAEVDEVVAALTAVVMVKKMQQRARERGGRTVAVAKLGNLLLGDEATSRG